MAEIALIPGYATEVTMPPWVPAHRDDAGFCGFAELLGSGKARAFRWGIVRAYPMPSSFDLRKPIALYYEEQKRAFSAGTFAALKLFLEETQPRILVAHSLGARILAEYSKTHALPSSVEKIIFTQADMATDATWHTPGVRVINNYCPWDPTLSISAILHARGRAGLTGLRGAENRLTALWHPINLHTCSIRSQRLVREVLKLLGEWVGRKAPTTPYPSSARRGV